MSMPRQLPLFATLLLIAAASCCSCSTKSREGRSENSELSAGSIATTLPVAAYRDVDPAVRDQLAKVLTGYFTLSQAFIAGSLSGSKVAAAALSEVIKKLDVSKLTGEQMDFYFLQSSGLKTGLVEIGNSSNILSILPDGTEQ